MLFKLPSDILVDHILSKLPFQDAINLMKAAKETNSGALHSNYWQRFGANNFDDFWSRFEKIPLRYQQDVLESHFKLGYIENLIQASDAVCKTFDTSKSRRDRQNALGIFYDTQFAKDLAEKYPQEGFNVVATIFRILKDGDYRLSDIFSLPSQEHRNILFQFRVWPNGLIGGVYKLEDIRNSSNDYVGRYRQPDVYHAVKNNLINGDIINTAQDIYSLIEGLQTPRNQNQL